MSQDPNPGSAAGAGRIPLSWCLLSKYMVRGMGESQDRGVPLRIEQRGDDRPVVGCVGHGQPRGRSICPAASCSASRVIPTLIVLAAWLVTAATASAFSAHGSVEQVYVTGLAPSAEMSLLRSDGETVSTQTADARGGLLFRKVAPGKRYRVRLTSTSEEFGPITVHTQAAKPWDHSIYKQSIPNSGYTYLTTRDGTQLAIDVHPPTFSVDESTKASIRR